MTVTPTTPTSLQSLSPVAPPPPPQPNALSSDFETFLRMLTVQMKNQDPLNPVEATDFAVQLATFSGVEQQVKTNDLLEKLSTAFAGNGMSGFATWIGTEVRTAAAAEFEGQPLTLYPPAGMIPADQTFLVVRDSSGLPVARTQVQTGGAPLTWAGVGADGTPFAPGLYRFEIERVVSGEVAATVPLEHYAEVREVQAGEDGPILLLAGGATVPAAEAKAVRPAGSGL